MYHNQGARVDQDTQTNAQDQFGQLDLVDHFLPKDQRVHQENNRYISLGEGNINSA